MAPFLALATPAGFEPALSSVTGRRLKPLVHGAKTWWRDGELNSGLEIESLLSFPLDDRALNALRVFLSGGEMWNRTT